MLRSDLCGYSDTFIVVKVTITATCTANATKKKQNVSLQE